MLKHLRIVKYIYNIIFSLFPNSTTMHKFSKASVHV